MCFRNSLSKAFLCGLKINKYKLLIELLTDRVHRKKIGIQLTALGYNTNSS